MTLQHLVWYGVVMSSKSSQYEHLLFGSVTESELPSLMHRLRGLCDYATRGGVPFVDREIGYKIGDFPCTTVYSSNSNPIP